MNADLSEDYLSYSSMFLTNSGRFFPVFDHSESEMFVDDMTGEASAG
jgi:hypothetical protein